MSDSDAPDVMWEEEPVARKRHVCCECRGCIEKGEKYSLYKGVWCGEFSTIKVCADCDKLRNDIYKETDYLPAFEFLGNSVVNDVYDEFLERYIEIREKRGAPESGTEKYKKYLKSLKEARTETVNYPTLKDLGLYKKIKLL